MILLFTGLILLQVIILNNINFLGYINPYFYMVFVLFYPIKKLDSAFLLISFLLGLAIDFFANTGGVNAAATLFIAFIRLPVIKLVLGKSELEYGSLSLKKMKFNNAFTIILILTLVHHFIIYALEYFSFDNIGLILQKTLLTGIFTLILILISFIFFSDSKNVSY